MMRWIVAAGAALMVAGAAAQTAPSPKDFDPEQQMGMERPKTDTPQGPTDSAGRQADDSPAIGSPGTLLLVPFGNMKDQLGPRALSVLAAGVARLAEGDGPLEIGGYTSAVGQRSYNQALSERRAQTVKQYLIDHGVAAERLKAVGYGPDQPIDSNDTPQGRRHNRRVEIKPG